PDERISNHGGGRPRTDGHRHDLQRHLVGDHPPSPLLLLDAEGHCKQLRGHRAARSGAGRPRGHRVPAELATQASTSSAVRGISPDSRSAPSAVTRMSSSMRTPMPRYSSGTVRSSGWKYRPGSIVKTMPASTMP